jgi:hypothetical protein
MVKRLLKGCPARVKLVVVDAAVALTGWVACVNDDLEAMAMHISTLVARGHIGQLVR